MIVAKVHISGAQALAVDKKPITAGMAGAQVCMNYIDSVWNGLKKTVVFYGAVTRYVVTDAEVVTIPTDVLAKPNIQLVVGVYGENDAGSLVIPTLRTELGVIRVGTMVSGNKAEYVLDTSDATATAEDMAKGVTAYVNGEKITGSLPVIIGVTHLSTEQSYTESTGKITLSCKQEVKQIFKDGANINLTADAGGFGDAAADDVALGKTFTSAAGLMVTGTHECAEGLDTSDATATSEDMAKGVTAYVNGQKVTGTIPEKAELLKYDAVPEETIVISGSNGDAEDPGRNGTYIRINSALDESDGKVIISPGTVLSQIVEPGKFGDAAAEDVVAGKTFTSAAGLMVTGTHECSGGLDTSDATATSDDMADGVTAYVNGEKVTGSVSVFNRNDTLVANYLESVTTCDDTIEVTGSSVGNHLLRTRAKFEVKVPNTEFGDAAASDVAAGKTFTSAAGLMVTGTREDSAGGSLAASDDGDGNVTLVLSGSASVDDAGNVTIS